MTTIDAKRRDSLLRAMLAAAGGVLVTDRARAAAADESVSRHFPFGRVAPVRPIPSLPVLTAAQQRIDLATLLRGKTSALQLMFTGCSATCPLQGALFAQAQREILTNTDRRGEIQFVSISIDPLSDTPQALSQWLGKLDARPGWSAVAPRVEDVDKLVTLLTAGGERHGGGVDPHTGQVYVVNRNGELVFRTPSMPMADQIVTLLRRVDAII